MASNTLQGLEDSVGPTASAAVAEALAEAQELFSKEEDLPTACVQLYADPEHYDAVLALAGILLGKGLKVDFSFEKGRHAVTGEVQEFIQLEARDQ